MCVFNLKALFCSLIILVSGCASYGVNHRPEVVGGDIANYEVDLKDCQQLAATNKRLDKTTEGGIAGAAVGAVASAIEKGGDTLTGVVIGAVVGITGGALISQNKQQNFIFQCMQQRGYNVVVDD